MEDNITKQLEYLNETKALIKQALINKGQDVSDTDTFRSYANKINDIDLGEHQNIPFYMIEQDDNGNLYMINNYDVINFMAYEIDGDGNFIVNQDDKDTAIYSISENYDLEVTV